MEKEEITKEFIKSIDDAFEIDSAYSWEGGAGLRFKALSDSKKKITFSVSGSSMCEHSGDEDGIRDQVWDLRGEEKTFKVGEKEYKARITEATVDITAEEKREDSDYEVDVKGEVTVEIL